MNSDGGRFPAAYGRNRYLPDLDTTRQFPYGPPAIRKGFPIMPIIHAVATVNAKGRITLPKAIRREMGVGAGFRLAFDLHEDGRIVVSLTDAEHDDPAIGAFLDLLSADIRAGRHVHSMPDDLEQFMLEYTQLEPGSDRDIGGHDIPESDVRQRFGRCRTNLPREFAGSEFFGISDESSRERKPIGLTSVK